MPLLSLIKENAELTGNKSGASVVDLCEWSGLSISEARPLLNKLYKDGEIVVREGINEKLIFNKND